jgi:hypothetical protein
MNINLTSEIIWSLAVTILIGLWLIWEALNIHPGIDILKISVNWFRDRPIILPSLLLLIFPFLLSGIIHNLPPNFNNIFDNKIIAQLLATFGAVISIYIANRALEKFKKTQEQKKIAKILIASMEAKLCIMILIKQIVQDNDRLKLYQKLIINEYAKHREKYNIYGYSPLEIQDILKTTAILFEGYGLRLYQNLRQTQTNGDELDNYL